MFGNNLGDDWVSDSGHGEVLDIDHRAAHFTEEMSGTLQTRTLDPYLLNASKAFAGITASARLDAMDAGRLRRFAKGQTVFEQQDEADTFHVLLGGRVKVAQLTPEGEQIIVRFVGPGDSLGCVAVCGGMRYPATATAIDDCQTLAWDRRVVRALAARYPEVSLNIMRVMGGRVMELQDRLREMATERVDRRLAHALVRLAAQSGRRVPEGVLIDLPLSRQDLAELAGTTLATVSRTLSAWAGRGIVSLGRQRVMIKRPHGLIQIAEDLAGP